MGIIKKAEKQLYIDNQALYNYYRERLINLALAQFEWNNLPETVDRHYLEKQFLYKGKAAIYKVQDTDIWLGTGYIAPKGRFDAYGYPTAITGVDFNARQIPTDEWVIAYDNMTRTSLLGAISMYAKLMWQQHMTFLSNQKFQNMPYVVPIPNKGNLTWQNLWLKISTFNPFVEVSPSLEIKDIQALDLRVDYIGPQLWDDLQRIWKDALSMLGITAETTKKERLIGDEIQLNRQADTIALNARLMNRVVMCNQLNERYGFDISVNLSSISPELNPLGQEMEEKDVSVHHYSDGDSPRAQSAGPEPEQP